MSAPRISPELILRAYSQGIFPMADSATAEEVNWYQPRQRGILPLENFHVPRRLKRTLFSEKFRVTADKSFTAVIAACGQSVRGREETWINPSIQNAFIALHQQGYAHSIEVWHQNMLCGGLYGLAIGGAFFGESMFSTQRDASKIALVHLAGWLIGLGFTVLDTQFGTAHLAQFGGIEIPHKAYMNILRPALEKPMLWPVQWIENITPQTIMARIENPLLPKEV